MFSAGTYVRAGLPEATTALAVLTGEPYPSRRKGLEPTPPGPDACSRLLEPGDATVTDARACSARRPAEVTD
jgi:hypothetical protein